MSKRRRWVVRGLVSAVVVGVLGAVGGPYVYTHFINKPKPRLTFASRDAQEAKAGDTTQPDSGVGASADAVDLSGTWAIGEGSEVGYRVKESINGQATEGVGRSSTIDGSVAVASGKLVSAEFSVDITSLKSDSGRRDAQFTGRIMNAEAFPVASFTTTSTPEFALPADGSTTTVSVQGVLALHGVEQNVTVQVTMRRKADTVQLEGSIPVTFADYEIDNPSIGPIKTGDTGLVEFLLTMRKQ